MASEPPTADAGGGDAPIGPAGACTDPKALIVAGSDVTEAKVDDTVGSDCADAHPFVVRATETARCAWLYVALPPPSGEIQLGVHSNSTEDHPASLRTSATFKNAVRGWNSAPLAAPEAVVEGERIWLGVTAIEEPVTLRVVASCPPPTARSVRSGVRGRSDRRLDPCTPRAQRPTPRLPPSRLTHGSRSSHHANLGRPRGGRVVRSAEC